MFSLYFSNRFTVDYNRYIGSDHKFLKLISYTVLFTLDRPRLLFLDL
jgi:hypothetical protein